MMRRSLCRCNNAYKEILSSFSMIKKGALLLIALLIVPSVFAALTATIGNPRMVLYGNVTSEDVLVIDNFVIVDCQRLSN